MDIIVVVVKSQFVLVYLHGIVSYFKFPGEHIGLVRRVLTILNESEATLK